jgi:sporulation protein YlmC with PRC-barrel domain
MRTVKLGSAIYGCDGKAGTLEEAVVDPQSQRVMGLVIQLEGILAREVVLPFEGFTREDRLEVQKTLSEIQGCPDYEKTDYSLPNVTPPNLLWPINYWQSIIEVDPGPLTVEHRNIPAQAEEISQGKHVECQDGSCGKIKGIVLDGNRITRVIIERGRLFHAEEEIPFSDVDRVSDTTVFVRRHKGEKKES